MHAIYYNAVLIFGSCLLYLGAPLLFGVGAHDSRLQF